MQPYPPLGTLYAATALSEHGISAAVFDPMLQDPVTRLSWRFCGTRSRPFLPSTKTTSTFFPRCA